MYLISGHYYGICPLFVDGIMYIRFYRFSRLFFVPISNKMTFYYQCEKPEELEDKVDYEYDQD